MVYPEEVNLFRTSTRLGTLGHVKIAGEHDTEYPSDERAPVHVPKTDLRNDTDLDKRASIRSDNTSQYTTTRKRERWRLTYLKINKILRWKRQVFRTIGRASRQHDKHV